MLKRLTHTGSTLRPRPVAEKAAIARALEDESLAADRGRQGEAGDLHAPSRLREAAAAHALMETSEHIGKIVLTV